MTIRYYTKKITGVISISLVFLLVCSQHFYVYAEDGITNTATISTNIGSPATLTLDYLLASDHRPLLEQWHTRTDAQLIEYDELAERLRKEFNRRDLEDKHDLVRKEIEDTLKEGHALIDISRLAGIWIDNLQNVRAGKQITEVKLINILEALRKLRRVPSPAERALLVKTALGEAIKEAYWHPQNIALRATRNDPEEIEQIVRVIANVLSGRGTTVDRYLLIIKTLDGLRSETSPRMHVHQQLSQSKITLNHLAKVIAKKINKDSTTVRFHLKYLQRHPENDKQLLYVSADEDKLISESIAQWYADSVTSSPEKSESFLALYKKTLERTQSMINIYNIPESAIYKKAQISKQYFEDFLSVSTINITRKELQAINKVLNEHKSSVSKLIKEQKAFQKLLKIALSRDKLSQMDLSRMTDGAISQTRISDITLEKSKPTLVEIETLRSAIQKIETSTKSSLPSLNSTIEKYKLSLPMVSTKLKGISARRLKNILSGKVQSTNEQQQEIANAVNEIIRNTSKHEQRLLLLKAALDEAINDLGITRNDIADNAGINRARLTALRRGTGQATVEEIETIYTAINFYKLETHAVKNRMESLRDIIVECLDHGMPKSTIEEISGVGESTINRILESNFRFMADKQLSGTILDKIINDLSRHNVLKVNENERKEERCLSAHKLLTIAYQEYGISPHSLSRETPSISKDRLWKMLDKKLFRISAEELQLITQGLERLRMENTFYGLYKNQSLLTWSKHASLKKRLRIETEYKPVVIKSPTGDIIAEMPYDITLREGIQQFNIIRCDNLYLNYPVNYINALMILSAIKSKPNCEKVSFDYLKESAKMTELVAFLQKEGFIKNLHMEPVNGRLMFVTAEIDHNVIKKFFNDLQKLISNHAERTIYLSA